MAGVLTYPGGWGAEPAAGVAEYSTGLLPDTSPPLMVSNLPPGPLSSQSCPETRRQVPWAGDRCDPKHHGIFEPRLMMHYKEP